MKVLLCLALAADMGIAAHAVELQTKINWSDFLSRHDLVWDELPKVWHESAFIGNGLLGATIYSETNTALQWDVGRSDVADRGNRLQIGRFLLDPAGEMQSGTMRLDLWNAEARGDLKTDLTSIKWRAFTHSDKPVTFIEWKDRRPKAGSKISFVHLPAIPAREEMKHTPIPEKEKNPDATFGEADGIHWCLQSFTAGGGYCVAWSEHELEPGHKLFAFTVDFTPSPAAPREIKAVADIRDALDKKFDDLVKSHRNWWHAYWPRSFISIPDTRMESFYWIQMYKLASGTRANRPALDLMGPWFRRTPWPKIWWNLNIQLTYWPVYAANRLSIGESLTRMLDANVANLISNVPEAWREDSAAIGRTSSYDCKGGVGGKDGEERGDLTWTLHNYWLQYRYSGDEKMLGEKLYPLLKRAVGYYLHLLKPADNGNRLHMPLSLSPEFPKTAPDTNYDLALLRWALQTLIACNDRFALNDPLAAKWRDTLQKLVPFPADATGYMIGAGQPLDISHRHFSHLFMIYPLHLIDPESAADKPLAEKSLDHWIGFEGALQGYSFTGASAMSSWLGRKDVSVKLLNEFLDRFIKPNTMYLEAGPVIETPLAGAAAIHEIVLQSWSQTPFGTQIRVFPAASETWKNVTIHKMLAEGAFEISAVKRDGVTKFVQIKSLAGNPCLVRTSIEDPVALDGARQFVVRTGKDKNGNPVTAVDLKKGETVLLTSAKSPAKPEELVIEPVAPQPDRKNFYGSRKAAPVAQAADGCVLLIAKDAKLAGANIMLQGKGDGMNIGHWNSSADETAVWKIKITKPSAFKVFATLSSPGGGKFLVELRGDDDAKVATITASKKSTGNWETYEEMQIGTTTIPAAGSFQLRVSGAEGKPPGMNLKSVRLAAD